MEASAEAVFAEGPTGTFTAADLQPAWVDALPENAQAYVGRVAGRILAEHGAPLRGGVDVFPRGRTGLEVRYGDGRAVGVERIRVVERRDGTRAYMGYANGRWRFV